MCVVIWNSKLLPVTVATECLVGSPSKKRWFPRGILLESDGAPMLGPSGVYLRVLQGGPLPVVNEVMVPL